MPPVTDVAAPATVVLRQTVRAVDNPPHHQQLPLSASDLPVLGFHYIQKGLFFPRPPMPASDLAGTLIASLERALAIFPPVAGRLATLPDGRIVIDCSNAGVDFTFVTAPSLTLDGLLPPSADVPAAVKETLFPMDLAVCYAGHSMPLMSFQLTELGDGAVFLGCAANHAVTDGTSFWGFINGWAAVTRGEAVEPPDFTRGFFGDVTPVLRFPGGAGPEKVTSYDVDAPLRERVVHFSASAVLELKSMANIAGDGNTTTTNNNPFSSFQSVCALLWRCVTRSRMKHLSPEAPTTFRIAVNYRHRLRPPISPQYFGVAVASPVTTATVADVLANDLRWAASRLHATLDSYDDAAVRREAEQFAAAPRLVAVGNPSGAGIVMGSSHRLPMYEGNDFGWGLPVAVRSGRAHKFDGKLSAFPAKDGDGMDIEMCLSPATMAELLRDGEFLRYAPSA